LASDYNEIFEDSDEVSVDDAVEDTEAIVDDLQELMYSYIKPAMHQSILSLIENYFDINTKAR
jgi:hypothetical protein